MNLLTPRLILRPWRDNDAEEFVAMHTDPAVMVDTPAFSRARAEAKFERYRKTLAEVGFCRWAVETLDGDFIGYVGILPISPDHPLAPGVEIGWRLSHQAWGHGYATEAAMASLADGFDRLGFAEVFSYTAPENHRSQAVMRRLNLARTPDRDFIDRRAADAPWNGLVWMARCPTRRVHADSLEVALASLSQTSNGTSSSV